MATEKELQEQYELNKKKLALNEQSLRETSDLDNKNFAMSQDQLSQSYKLALDQLKAMEQEKQGQSTKLAQQAYVSKRQAERVMPDVLSASGLANTGYENVRRGQIESSYKSQYGDIRSDLESYLGQTGRQRSQEDMQYNQSLSRLDMQKQQAQLALQQNLRSLELQRESASLDYRYALQKIQEANAAAAARPGGSGSQYSANMTQSQMNAQDISRALAEGIKAGTLNTNTAAKVAQKYYDDGYMENKDYLTTVYGAKQLADAVAQKNAQTTPQSSKLKKALAIGLW
jgi:hypothetical protein